MRVAYPKGGPHVLALFNTSWQKGHGILARTWAQAEKVFRTDKFQRHIAKQGDLRVKRALDIDIVSAPMPWRRDIAAKLYAEERSAIKHSLRDAVAKLPHLPRGFSRCPHYVPWGTVDVSESDKLEHWQCDNCGGSGVVVQRSRFLEVCARVAAGDDPTRLLVAPISAWGHTPTAPPAEPGREIMVLSECSGVEISAFSGCLNTYDIRHTICHFQIRNERTDVADRLQSAVDALYAGNARPDADRERRKAEAEKAAAQRREAENEALRRFLG